MLLSAQDVVIQQPVKLPFNIFRDSTENFIPSGYMGDTRDIILFENYKINPAGGKTCIKVVYNVKDPNSKDPNWAGWAGIYWLNPANNWAAIKDAGFNLTGATKFKFMAKGNKGDEKITCQVGGVSGEFPDSFKAEMQPTVLTKEWKEYEIDLTGQDLTYIIGGFMFSVNAKDSPTGCIFYLDDMRFE